MRIIWLHGPRQLYYDNRTWLVEKLIIIMFIRDLVPSLHKCSNIHIHMHTFIRRIYIYIYDINIVHKLQEAKMTENSKFAAVQKRAHRVLSFICVFVVASLSTLLQCVFAIAIHLYIFSRYPYMYVYISIHFI